MSIKFTKYNFIDYLPTDYWTKQPQIRHKNSVDEIHLENSIINDMNKISFILHPQ